MNQSDKGKAVGASDFVTEAYNAEGEQGLKDFYAKWAQEYDTEMLEKLNYTAPGDIAQAMARYLEDSQCRILDVGCGTGLTAQALHRLGFSNLYGIDLSQEMVDVARVRGIYTGLVAADVTQPLDFESGFFGGIISSGTFTHGHVGPEPLPELFRILRPGGILTCTVKDDLWRERGFDQAFEQLVSSDQAVCLSRELKSYYLDSDPDGWFCVYQKSRS